MMTTAPPWHSKPKWHGAQKTGDPFSLLASNAKTDKDPKVDDGTIAGTCSGE
jgi:hypothetical protein